MRTSGGLRGFVVASLGCVVVAACSSGAVGDKTSSGAAEEGLTGCHGTASSTIPASHEYVLTSFGNSPSDNGEMSCGEYTDDGDWYYSASRQRYGCGSHVKVEANGKCVVVETDDYGPDVCVENAAGMPILDASPLVAEHLFGTSSAGWSDGLKVMVTEVAATTPLGICTASAPPPAVDAGAPKTTPDAGTPTIDAGSPPPSSGPPCTGDGDCNPGDDGSGLICSTTTHACIPGCHSDAQCPGDTTCHHTTPTWQCE
jgi:hypothetical protein